MGGGTKSFSFENVGDTVTGVVMDPPYTKLQQTDFEGNPKVWPSNGQPKWMYRITLQTDLRDPADPYDDGVRNIYVKWLSQQAVQNAVRAAGARTLLPGGVLTVTFTGVGPKKPGMPQPPKLYAAQYLPPAGDFMDSAAVAPQSPAPAPQSAPPAATTPAQQSILQRMRDQAAAGAAARAGGTPLPPPPASHHAVGEPPF